MFNSRIRPSWGGCQEFSNTFKLRFDFVKQLGRTRFWKTIAGDEGESVHPPSQSPCYCGAYQNHFVWAQAYLMAKVPSVRRVRWQTPGGVGSPIDLAAPPRLFSRGVMNFYS